MQLAGSLRRQPRTIPLNFGPGDRIEIVSLSRIGRVCAENVKLKRGSFAFFHLWECANLPRASSLLTDSGARLRPAALARPYGTAGQSCAKTKRINPAAPASIAANMT
jgi:hypothetical protein